MKEEGERIITILHPLTFILNLKGYKMKNQINYDDLLDASSEENKNNPYMQYLRKRYPQYKTISDGELALAFKDEYYSHMSDEDYLNQTGIKNIKPITIQPYAYDQQSDTKEEVLPAQSSFIKENKPEQVDTSSVWSKLANMDLQTPQKLEAQKTLDIAKQADEQLKKQGIKSQDIFKPLSIDEQLSIPNKDRINTAQATYDMKEELLANPVDSSITDQTQSSLLKQSRTSARGVAKLAKKTLENLNMPILAKSIDMPLNFTQEEADRIVGFSKSDRDKENKINKELYNQWQGIQNGTNKDYTKFVLQSLSQLPSTLADSSGEMAQLFMGVPGLATAVNTRVSNFEEEYTKNNKGKKPDLNWYLQAVASQTALLGAERFGITKALPNMFVNPKSFALASGVGALGEGVQEYGEGVSEEYLTQKEGDKSLKDILLSPQHSYGAMQGALMGGALGGASHIGGKIRQNLDKNHQANEAITNELNNITKDDLQREFLSSPQTHTQDIEPTQNPNYSIKNIDGVATVELHTKADDEGIAYQVNNHTPNVQYKSYFAINNSGDIIPLADDAKLEDSFKGTKEEQDQIQSLIHKAFNGNAEDSIKYANQIKQIVQSSTTNTNQKAQTSLENTSREIDEAFSELNSEINNQPTSQEQNELPPQEEPPNEIQEIQQLVNTPIQESNEEGKSQNQPLSEKELNIQAKKIHDSLSYKDAYNLKQDISQTTEEINHLDNSIETLKKWLDAIDNPKGEYVDWLIPLKKSFKKLKKRDMSAEDLEEMRQGYKERLNEDLTAKQQLEEKKEKLTQNLEHIENTPKRQLKKERLEIIKNRLRENPNLLNKQDETTKTNSKSNISLDTKVITKAEKINDIFANNKDTKELRKTNLEDFKQAQNSSFENDDSKLLIINGKFFDPQHPYSKEQLKDIEDVLTKGEIDTQSLINKDISTSYDYKLTDNNGKEKKVTITEYNTGKTSLSYDEEYLQETKTTYKQNLNQFSIIVPKGYNKEIGEWDYEIVSRKATKWKEPTTGLDFYIAKDKEKGYGIYHESGVMLYNDYTIEELKDKFSSGFEKKYKNQPLKDIIQNIQEFVNSKISHDKLEALHQKTNKIKTEQKNLKKKENAQKISFKYANGDKLTKANGYLFAMPFKGYYAVLHRAKGAWRISELSTGADINFHTSAKFTELEKAKQEATKYLERLGDRNLPNGKTFDDIIKEYIEKNGETGNKLPQNKIIINQQNDIIQNKKQKEKEDDRTREENSVKHVRKDDRRQLDQQGHQGDGQRERGPISREKSNSDDRGDGNSHKPRLSSQRGEGDSDTQPHNQPVKNQHIDTFSLNQDQTYKSGEVARFGANIDAINLLQRKNHHFTAKEKEILSSYTGWGGLSKAFPNAKGEWSKGWSDRGELLKNTLFEEDYNEARRGILSAFYTPIPLVKTMWEINKTLGFQGGMVLEPSVGVGRFLGLVPTSLKSSTAFTGVELDNTTAKIASALYDKSNIINSGFESTNYENVFDMVIGNPPYGNFKIYDKNNKTYSKLSAHNYFVVKSLDALKEEGVLNFVISTSFLDNLDANTKKLRLW